MLVKDRQKLIIPFLAPGLLLYLVFFIYPAIQAFMLSMYDWSGFNLPKTFVGLRNFQLLFNDDSYLTALKNTLIILLAGGFFIFLLSFIFSAMLGSGVRGRKFYRAVFFFPNVVAAIALCTFWGFVYNQRFGLINGFLKLVGLESLIRPWTDPSRLLGAELVALIWIYTGYFLVILLAGADKIPTEIYDAARVDGANPFQMFVQVTIPLMWDVIGVALILWMITALKQFEFIYAFTGASVNQSTYTMPIYLYIMGFGKRDPIFRLGYSSAIGITLLSLVVIFAVIMRRFLKREVVQF